jgi:protein SCO1/2
LPVLSLLVLFGCQKTAESPAAKEYDIKGKVVAVDADKKTVTLDHEEIPGVMKAMEMKYPVTDAKVLQGLAPGDQVQGRLEAKGGDYTITRLEKR